MKKTELRPHWIAILFILLLSMGETACKTDDSEKSVSVKAPEVSAVSPADASTDVELAPTMSVTFDESMNPVSILVNTEDTTCSKVIQVSADDFQTCVKLSSNVVSEYPYQTFSFQAASPFEASTTYKIKVTQEARDIAGDGMIDEFVTANGFTTSGTSSTSNPDASASSLSFFDYDMDPGQIEGTLLISKATDESEVSEYRLYWGSDATTKLSGETTIDKFTADGTDKTYSFSADTAIPTGATHLLVYSIVSEVEAETPTALDIPDGVVAKVAEINTNTDTGSRPGKFTNVNGTLFFFANADSSTNVHDLWKSDGTSVVKVNLSHTPFKDYGDYSSLSTAVIGSTLYFSSAFGDSNNVELWKSDGTDGGTDIVAEINSDTYTGSNPSHFAVLGTELFFVADDGSYYNKIYKTSGVGFSIVNDPGLYNEVGFLKTVGDKIFFSFGADSSNMDLWTTDGSSKVQLTPSPAPKISKDSISTLVELNGNLYFPAKEDTSPAGIELWKSDGSDSGTMRVVDIYPGSQDSNPKNLQVFKGELFFGAQPDDSTRQLWKTNGISGGTSIKTISTDNLNTPSKLTVVDKTLFFVAENISGNNELWKSDGTPDETEIIEVNPSTSTGSDPSHLTAVGDRLFFFANGDTCGNELWVSDGKTTRRLTDLYASGDSFDSYYSEMMLVGTNLFFSAKDTLANSELWRYFVK